MNLIDTPGDINYTTNMVSSMFPADAVVLVVSAREGDFEASFFSVIKEQTLLAFTFGVK